jgi:hypothetical protein
MNAYPPTRPALKLVIAAVTLAISAASLELVAGSMLFPDATSVEARRAVLAAEQEGALRLRAWQHGAVLVAASKADARL